MKRNVARPCSLVSVALLFGVMCFISPACFGQSPDKTSEADKHEINPQVHLKLIAGGSLTARLADDHFRISTQYGDLTVPVADVETIRFAIRVSEEDQQLVDAAIADLGTVEFEKRESALKTLKQLGEKSIPQLVVAANSRQPEVAKRAGDALTKLRSTFPIQRWAYCEQDIIRTKHSWIAGRLDVESLDIHTMAFGQQQILLMDIAELGPGSNEDSESPSTSADGPDLYYLSPEADMKNKRSQVTNDLVNMQFVDGSQMELFLKEKQISLLTQYGKLQIPGRDLVRIQFAKRPRPDVAEKIDKAIQDFASEDPQLRQKAMAELHHHAGDAVGGLQRVADFGSTELASVAALLLEKLKQSMPAEHWDQGTQQSWDIVQTNDCVFRGWISSRTFEVQTAQFGSQQISLSSIALLGEAVAISMIPDDVQPDPGHLSNYRDKVGQVFYFKVTGTTKGTVWGDGAYTSDSRLAVAAVHAGVLKPNESGIVKVKIAGPLTRFSSSTKNGVTSHAFGAYPGSYQVLEK